jgi:hypothetical protein
VLPELMQMGPKKKKNNNNNGNVIGSVAWYTYWPLKAEMIVYYD